MGVVKAQGHCAVCMAQQVVWDGVLVTHGYKRPGIGCIVGTCFGASRAAWQVSPEGAVAYVGWLRVHLTDTTARLARLRAGKVDVLHREQPQKDERGHGVYLNGVRQYETVPVKRGEERFPQLEQAAIADTEAQQRHITLDIAAIEKRIATWAPAPLLAHDAPDPATIRPVLIAWNPKASVYAAVSVASGKTIEQGDDPAALYALVNARGWTLELGDPVPDRVPTSERLHEVLKNRRPSSNADVNIERADRSTAAVLLNAYAGCDDDGKAMIDACALPTLLRFARDTAEGRRVENVSGTKTVARLRLWRDLRAVPDEQQPSHVLFGTWERATFEYHGDVTPRVVTVQHDKCRRLAWGIEDRSARTRYGGFDSYRFDWMKDLRIE